MTRCAQWQRPLPLLSALLLLIQAACLPASTSAPPTASPIPPTATVTIQFPTIAPTATELILTPVPRPQPLADTSRVLYATDFTDPEGWGLERDSFGAVSHINDTLSLVVSRPGMTRIVRSPAATTELSFVLDAELRSEVCGSDDEYGLVFRLGQEGDHLRFTVTCGGGVRLRRVVGGASRALVPFIPEDPAVVAGAPARNRLTVRALGDDLRLYVNGIQVIRAGAPALPPGGFGLVVTSAARQGQTTVTVDSFRLLQLEETPSTTPNATATE